MMAKWAHARVIAVDVMADKLQVCKDLGADMVVDASNDRVVEEILDLTGGAGVDVAIDYVSTQSTAEQAVGSLGIRGRFVTLGGAGQPFTAPAPAMLAKELEAGTFDFHDRVRHIPFSARVAVTTWRELRDAG